MLKRRIVWHVVVTEHLDRMLKEYLKLDSFKTKSEFIRNAVREKLEDELAKPRKGFVHDALRQVGEENEK